MAIGIDRSARASIGGMRRAAFAPGLTLVLALAAAGCSRGSEGPEDPAPASSEDAVAGACTLLQIPETRAPDTRPEYDDPGFWLAKLDRVDPDASDRELLDATERAQLAETVAELPGGWRDPIDPSVAAPSLVDRELGERRDWLRGRVDSGKYVEGTPGALAEAEAVIDASTPIADHGTLHYVAAETPLWCVPTTKGLYTEPIDRGFDRNRCASLHLGEYLRAIRSAEDGRWIYVDAGHSVGWIAPDPEQTLSPAMSAEALADHLERANVFVLADHPPDSLRAGTRLIAEGDDYLRPTASGLRATELPETVVHRDGPLPFTRRNVFRQAFAQLDQPYGWGGRDGHRDCSRYLHDLFAQFGVRLARNSGVQSKLGTRSVDVSELDDDAKRAAIREAAESGVVLLYMPGHIMLYLGRDGDHDYGISALSEYLVPCDVDPNAPPVVHRLDRVAVTTLELGRGTERRAFIERITRIAVFE